MNDNFMIETKEERVTVGPVSHFGKQLITPLRIVIQV